jgi:hypothetical protein
MGPTGAADPLRGSYRELLSRLIDPSVFQRMAEGQAALPQAERYVGADLVRDLNRGLFNELDRANPIIGLYRRDLQRTYVRLLVGRMSGEEQRTPRATSELESPFDLDWNPSRITHSAPPERRLSPLLAEAAKDQRRAQNAPSEFRAALRVGIEDLAAKIKAARKRVKDDETSLHMKDLLYELERGH